MTVSSAVNRVQASGNGVTTAFSFPYYFIDDSHLVVIITDTDTGVETTQTITTDYTVSGAGNTAGGTVTMLTAPASGERLTIIREVPYTQETDYTESSAFPAESTEDALDLLTMQAQQLNEEVGRSLRFAETTTLTGGDFIIEEPEADNYVGWDSTGTILENKGVSSTPIDTDVGLAANSDVLVASQKATKAYADTKQPLTGTITNDDAPAGIIGEYISSEVLSGSAVSLTTTVVANVTSISLTGGDWDVWANAGTKGDVGTTLFEFNSSISATSATLATTNDKLSTLAPSSTVFGNGALITNVVGPTRISLPSAVTIYLVARASFSGGACSAYGKISARRVR